MNIKEAAEILYGMAPKSNANPDCYNCGARQGERSFVVPVFQYPDGNQVGVECNKCLMARQRYAAEVEEERAAIALERGE